MKLCLGTANFGNEYNGVKLNKKEIYYMLDMAKEAGIEYIDTAKAYGESEDILFSYLYLYIDRFKIITKTQGQIPLDRNYHAVLAHGIEYINPKVNGASVYLPHEAVLAAQLSNIKYIQIPYSAFDNIIDCSIFYGLTKKNGIKVFARSVFLKGILQREHPPDIAKGLTKKLNEFKEIADRHGISCTKAALLFVLKNRNIDYVVVGVENGSQLAELIQIASKNYYGTIVEELRQKFTPMNVTILDIEKWRYYEEYY